MKNDALRNITVVCVRCGKDININEHIFQILVKDSYPNKVESPVCRKCIVKHMENNRTAESKSAK